jgi:hypothetical protein
LNKKDEFEPKSNISDFRRTRKSYISKMTFLGDSTLDGGVTRNARHVAGYIWDKRKIIIFECPRNQ